MTAYVCIGVPYYLGESLPDRREVEALRNTGIADEWMLNGSTLSRISLKAMIPLSP